MRTAKPRVKDLNLDGLEDASKPDPYLADTDGDGLTDRAEPNRFVDTSDTDSTTNGRDTDSNDDGANDNQQVWVQFRTNAVDGNYASSSVWIAIDPDMDMGKTSPHIDFSASHALYIYDSTVASPSGPTIQIMYYRGTLLDPDPQDLKTPEGYGVHRVESSPSYVYIQMSASQTVKFVKSSNAPGDYSTSTGPVDSFTFARRETYEWRKAVDDDTDHDKLGNTVEGGGCGTDSFDPDSDDDGIQDGTERDWCVDTDHDGKKNAMDVDSDNDGIADGTEDADFDGVVDPGELDGLNPDTDGDGIQDGTERGLTTSTDTADTCENTGQSGCSSAWIFVADEDSATTTDPFDRDTDNDAVEDGKEDANRNGKRDQTGGVYTELNPLSVDSDGDGLQDGQEWGLTTAGKDTDLSVFKPDLDPSTQTDPLKADTDGDGILDGTEDLNRNGRVDSGEANPSLWDTDRDGLPDGWVNFGSACTQPCVGGSLGGSWGEDKNLNGIRDQNTDGDFTETDFLASDSDVDGIMDGWELWGRWCYKTETGAQCDALTNRSVRQLWVASPEKNGALIADFDADGLRDGQEIAGWMVGIWRERTMEKVINYSVVSSPLLADTEGDTLTDFSEFMNGSDPNAADTDGDGITDPQEIARKSNITGIEGTPPQISNVKLQVGIDWDWWGFLYLPLKSHVTVSFDVSDNVGLDTVTVKFIRYTGTETRQLLFSNTPGSYTTSTHVEMRFDFSIFEALVAGADVNITAYDVNGNGAWGDFHIKSVLDAIVDAIAAFLSAIAKVLMEALSALANFVASLLKELFMGIIHGLVSMLGPMIQTFMKALLNGPLTRAASYPTDPLISALWVLTAGFGFAFGVLLLVELVECAFAICATIFSGGGYAVLKQGVVEFMKKGVTELVKGLAKKALKTIAGLTFVLAAGLDLSLSLMPVMEQQLRTIVKGLVDVVLIVSAFATLAFTWKSQKLSWKTWAATWALFGLALSVLGNDIAGDWLQNQDGISSQNKARIFFLVDSMAWVFALLGVFKLRHKGDATEEAVQTLKEACGGVVPIIEEALVYGAFADTSATFLWGLGTQKYDA